MALLINGTTDRCMVDHSIASGWSAVNWQQMLMVCLIFIGKKSVRIICSNSLIYFYSVSGATVHLSSYLAHQFG